MNYKTLAFVILAMIIAGAVALIDKPDKEVRNTTSHSGRTPVVIFHAGSLSVPFARMEQAFEARHPDIDIVREAAGSRTCARKITDLHQEADIMASADESVITTLLFPDFTDFSIAFARNEMVIMYTNTSRYHDTITAENWPDILLKKEVSYAHSDPNKDPCGYRTRFVWQLEEKYSNRPGLYQQLTKKMNPAHIRPKETDLIALLEAGEIDYLFIYRSVAEQHHAPFVTLPEEINLGSVKFSRYYASASLKINGKKPGTFIEKRGAPMKYAVTVLKKAPHRKEAVQFLAFLLSKEGQNIMKKSGQPPLVPARAKGFDALPKTLLPFVAKPKY